ncbi:uncharacterized protein LOC108837825 [Raphanus sativus]|uniref:Uncharacterized protein LOC108837825 n=1 Tax=Raphanus sativus TaxID=3726 RepID=A0A9W3CE72_RAPSA|nr:uncharacterized protein LOC108837825 [Raphanus sativus]
MGGNSSKQSSRSSFYKSRRSSHRVQVDDGVYTRKAWASDEDKRHWVAEPGIDRKASAFIARFHASRVSESERQTLPPCQSHHN